MPKTLSDARRQFLFDVFVTAIEGRLLWAVIDKYHWGVDAAVADSTIERQYDLEGFHARIRDVENGLKSYQIDSWVIRKGLGVIKRMKDDPVTGSPSGGLHKSYRGQVLVADHQNDASDIDASLADCIVQCGLFGEVKYS